MKTKFIMFFLAMGIAASSSAQLFVGGSFSFSTNGGTEKENNVSVDLPSNTSLNISPKVGFYLDDKMAIGTQIGLFMNRTNNNSSPEVINSTTGFSISPFLRYHFLEIDALSILAEASLGLGYSRDKIKSGGVTIDGPKTTLFGMNLVPGVSYKVSDKISIEAFLGGLSFISQTEKEANGDKTTNNSFMLNFSTTLGLGFIYRL